MRCFTLRSCTQCLQICCVFVTAISVALASPQSLAQVREKEPIMKHPTAYQTIQVDGLSIFYREAGPKDAPTILLLHGLPSSSRMFQPLLTRLADNYPLVAPDYPGFGHSDSPDPKQFDYTFDHMASVMALHAGLRWAGWLSNGVGTPGAG